MGSLGRGQDERALAGRTQQEEGLCPGPSAHYSLPHPIHKQFQKGLFPSTTTIAPELRERPQSQDMTER